MVSLAVGHRRGDFVRVFPVYFAASRHFVMNLLALDGERRAGHVRPVAGAQPFHFRSDARVPVFPLQQRIFRSRPLFRQRRRGRGLRGSLRQKIAPLQQSQRRRGQNRFDDASSATPEDQRRGEPREPGAGSRCRNWLSRPEK